MFTINQTKKYYSAHHGVVNKLAVVKVLKHFYKLEPTYTDHPVPASFFLIMHFAFHLNLIFFLHFTSIFVIACISKIVSLHWYFNWKEDHCEIFHLSFNNEPWKKNLVQRIHTLDDVPSIKKLLKSKSICE